MLASSGRATTPIVRGAFFTACLFCALLAYPAFISSVSQSRPDSTAEGIHLTGHFDLILSDKYGNVKQEAHIDNMIVDSGYEGIASRIAPHDGAINPGSAFNYIAIGTGNTPPSPDQTGLFAELARLQDSTATYTNSGSKQLALSATFPAGVATGTIRESGIFNAASGGDMLSRQAFTDIVKGESDVLTITWTLTLSSS